MTKREFDAMTKQNYGRRMESDVRCDYRSRRFRQIAGQRECFLARRARDVAAGNRMRRSTLPTLAVGQKWRNVAAVAVRTGRKMTEGLGSATPGCSGCGACGRSSVEVSS